MKNLKLIILCLIGILIVSVPVTVAVFTKVAGVQNSPITIGEPIKTVTDPKKAIAKARTCKAENGYYALTFDDGPRSVDDVPRLGTTRQLVAALKSAKAVATFFDVGIRARRNPELVDLQRTAGMIGNHSYHHYSLLGLTQDQRFEEMTSTAKLLDYPGIFFRPPYGELTPESYADVVRTGLEPTLWTVDTFDYRNPTVEDIVDRASKVEAEGIILLHEGHPNTVKAIPLIVGRLADKGLCPGFLAKTTRTVISAYRGTQFSVIAVTPDNVTQKEKASVTP